MDVIDGDVASAAKKLDGVLNNNNVGRDWATNRRHKPKGEERRKLISMRWRRRFKHEVRLLYDFGQPDCSLTNKFFKGC